MSMRVSEPGERVSAPLGARPRALPWARSLPRTKTHSRRSPSSSYDRRGHQSSEQLPVTVQPGGSEEKGARCRWPGPQAQGPGAGSPSAWEGPPLLGPRHLQASRRGRPPGHCPRPGELGLSVASSEGPLPAAGPPPSPACPPCLHLCALVLSLPGCMESPPPQAPAGRRAPRGSAGLAEGQWGWAGGQWG